MNLFVLEPSAANALAAPWRAAWAAIGVAPPPGLFEALCARYGEPRRRYHSLQHLCECLALAGRDAGLAQRPAEVALALWFHDAVYEPRRGDNERASADWAHAALCAAGAPPGVPERVQALVMATRHEQAPATPDEQLVADIDLAILGARAHRFEAYDEQIRAEYAHVPRFIYRVKRRAVLQSFLDRARIFATPAYRARFEAKARANLASAIARLDRR
jgi:predicted metal-dependent HD superfamily phosphohydrolase